MAAIDVSIVTSGHDVADARLHREVAALVDAGLSVEVLGLGSPASGPADAIVRTWPRRGPAGRVWQALTLPWRADGSVVITLDPDSAFGAWCARGVRSLRGPRRVLVTDVHEDYTALLDDRAWAAGLRGIAARTWARLGIQATRRADLVVVADEHLAPWARRRLVLSNRADVSMLAGPTPRGAVPRAVYVGDVRRSRGAFAMLEAIAAAPGWELDVVGPVAGEDAAELRARAHRPDLEGRVRWHGRQPPRDAWRVADGAWAGLLLLDDTPAFRDALPSKLFEYVACGLAVVTTALPRSASLVAETGAGVVVADAQEAAAVLRRWSAAPEELEALRTAARAARGAVDGHDELVAFAGAIREAVSRTSRRAPAAGQPRA